MCIFMKVRLDAVTTGPLLAKFHWVEMYVNANANGPGGDSGLNPGNILIPKFDSVCTMLLRRFISNFIITVYHSFISGAQS